MNHGVETKQLALAYGVALYPYERLSRNSLENKPESNSNLVPLYHFSGLVQF